MGIGNSLNSGRDAIAGASVYVVATAAVVVLPALLNLTRDNSNGALNSVTIIVLLLDWGSARWLGW